MLLQETRAKPINQMVAFPPPFFPTGFLGGLGFEAPILEAR